MPRVPTAIASPGAMAWTARNSRRAASGGEGRRLELVLDPRGAVVVPAGRDPRREIRAAAVRDAEQLVDAAGADAGQVAHEHRHERGRRPVAVLDAGPVRVVHVVGG